MAKRFFVSLIFTLCLITIGSVVQAQEWALVDQLDVGDQAAEGEHSYRAIDETWRGPRTLAYPDGRRIYDDGAAFRGSDSWYIRGLTPGRSLKVVKRTDFRVANQVTDVFVDGRYVGRWNMRGSSRGWADAEFIVPGQFITSSRIQFEQRFVSSAADANAFYYWAFQEPGPRPGGILGEIFGPLGGAREEPRPRITPEEQAVLDAMQRRIESEQALMDALRRYFESR